MKRHAADRQPKHRPGIILAVLIAAVGLALSGCGQLMDGDPDSLSVSFTFAGDGATPMATSTTQGISFTGNGEAVRSVVIGAIVISSPTGTGPGGSFTGADAGSLTPAQEDALEKDVEQSLQYLQIVQLPTAEDYVTFPLPPQNAGTWQLVAVGMRHQISTLGEVQDNSAIYYGFSNGFLNGVVQPGGTAPTITLVPWCTGNPTPPTGATGTGCP